MGTICYRQGGNLDVDEVIRLYRDSTLGERRPISHRPIMEAMLQHANLLITAWDENRLVGLSRTLTDFHYVAYLADLAVDRAYQKQGIGRRLIEETQDALAPTCFMTLLAAPAAHGYYGHVGFSPHPRAWMRPARRPPTLG